MDSYSTNGHLTSRSHIFSSVGDQEPGSPKMNPGLFPASSQMHLQWGLALYAQGRTQEALWDFFESVSTEPQNSLGHYMCGLAFQALGLSEEAQVEWETVLTLTSGDETPSGEAAPSSDVVPSVETQWAHNMAHRLLGRGLAEDEECPRPHSCGPEPPPREQSAINYSLNDAAEVWPAKGRVATRNQEDLESAICDTVHHHGGCSVKDQFISDQLEVTTEEQVIGWKQSFSAREGLECQPYQATTRQDSRQDGVIFNRTAPTEQAQSQHRNNRLLGGGLVEDGQSPPIKGILEPGDEVVRC